MPMISMSDIRYNAQRGAFEARVDIQRGDKTFRYPCSVQGPMTMDPSYVKAGLTRAAIRQTDSVGLMSVS